MSDCDTDWPLNLVPPGVRGLAPYQPGKPIDELERELGIENSIKLASNENPLGPSPHVIQAVKNAADGIARYPDGNVFALKRALAERHGVTDDCITVGNGSNDVLALLAEAFVSPGQEVIFSRHAFAVYPIATQAAGGTARIVPAREFGNDLGAMRGLICDATRLIFIANPNNPTGTWVGKNALREFIDSIPDHVIVVIDEAYFEYVDEADYPDTTPWIADYRNLVVTRTFSKAFGLAGLRVGYSISRPEVADVLNRVRQPFNVNSLAQTGALAALEDMHYLDKVMATNRSGMAQLERGFRERGLGFIPSVGNFVCVEAGDDAMGIYDRLLHAGVIVRPVANYELPRHLRVTVGTAEENDRFLSALDAALEQRTGT